MTDRGAGFAFTRVAKTLEADLRNRISQRAEQLGALDAAMLANCMNQVRVYSEVCVASLEAGDCETFADRLRWFAHYYNMAIDMLQHYETADRTEIVADASSVDTERRESLRADFNRIEQRRQNSRTGVESRNSGQLVWEVYDTEDEHVASAKRADIAAAIVALFGDDATVWFRTDTDETTRVWIEGIGPDRDGPAHESYDRAAQVMTGRVPG